MFEGQDGNGGMYTSPGGHEFGIQGWTYGPPVPRSITFFLDNTAIVADQYGRIIRRAVLPDGSEVRFADRAPDASPNATNLSGPLQGRPQFATHQQVIAALEAEKIDWQSYEVHYRPTSGGHRVEAGLTLERAVERQRKLLDAGHQNVTIGRSVVFAGWPQLPYKELKKLKEMPATPEADLVKIADKKLRGDALRLRREVDAAREKELQAVAE